MSNLKEESNLEERLANFTDHLLAGGSSRVPETGAEDHEGSTMENMVRRIVSTFPPQTPGSDLRNRLRANLTVEFRKQFPEGGRKRSGTISYPKLQWGLILGAAVILIAAMVLFPSILMTSPGAAGKISWVTPLIVIILGAAIFIFWKLRNKK